MSLLKTLRLNSLNVISTFLLCALVAGCTFSSSTDEINTDEASVKPIITQPEQTTQQMQTENELDLALKNIATEDIEINHISISELYSETVTQDETIEDMGMVVSNTVTEDIKIKTETNELSASKARGIIKNAENELKSTDTSEFKDISKPDSISEQEIKEPIEVAETIIKKDIPLTPRIITTPSDVSFKNHIPSYNKEYNATPATLKEMNDRLLKASQSSFSHRGNIASEDIGRYLVKDPVKKETPTHNIKQPKIVSFHAEKHVIYFDYKKTSLSNSAMTRMFKIAQTMKKSINSHIDIIGFTDSVGSQKYNQKLAEDRTKSTVEFLKQLGINQNRITVKSQGEQNQSVTTDDNVKEAQNRRVEMRITAP